MNALPQQRTRAEAEAIYSKLRRKVRRQTKAINAGDKEQIIQCLMVGAKIEQLSFTSPWASNYGAPTEKGSRVMAQEGSAVMVAEGGGRPCEVRTDDQAHRKLATVERLKAKLAARK
jgi:hypothetical protein